MDEMGARALMERMSVTEPPPSRVDLALARQRGAQRLRRRRLTAGMAPLLAAAAVAAIIAGTGALSRTAGSGQGDGRPVSPVRLTPPHRFDPLAPYAAFGWMPPGAQLAAVGTSSVPTQLMLLTGNLRAGQFSLTVWAPGTCNLSAAQIGQDLQEHRRPPLNCTQDPNAGWTDSVLRQAPAVRRRPAFWLRGHALAWEYAPRAWATLYAYGHHPIAVPTVLKVAARVRYAATAAPSVKFAYQLTGVPGAWRVTSATWHPSSSGLLGTSLDAGLIGQLTVTPGHSECRFDLGGSRRVTLNGVKAVFTLFQQKGARSYQGLCVPETDGLSVDFLLFRAPGSHSYPLGGVTGIFLHHLRLLGSDPAGWTTHPLGR
jgi:hypothetical protein